jgi:hypothetical protein
MLRRFAAQQYARHRRLVARGVGRWYVAALDGHVCGALGVCVEGTLARYQLIGTDPAFQRRGVCASLVFGAAECAARDLGARTFVICADASYHAARVYASVGLRPTEHLYAIARWA